MQILFFFLFGFLRQVFSPGTHSIDQGFTSNSEVSLPLLRPSSTFFLKKFYLTFSYVYAYMSVHIGADAQGSQKTLTCLELELQAVVSDLLWVLGTKLWYSTRQHVLLSAQLSLQPTDFRSGWYKLTAGLKVLRASSQFTVKVFGFWIQQMCLI